MVTALKQEIPPAKAEGQEAEVSDDDYVNDYSEMNSKRRRRETRQSASQAATTPILKGKYFIEDKVCTWDGKWGMGANGHINGVTSEFRYTMPIPAGSAMPTGPQSGYYNGFFWMKVTPPKRIPENDLHIEFVQEGSIYRVSGSGENLLQPRDDGHGVHQAVHARAPRGSLHALALPRRRGAGARVPLRATSGDAVVPA